VTEPALSPAADLVRRGDPDRFLSAMTAPPEARERLFALYAFNLELARIPAMVSEPMLGLIRVQWWREALDEIYAGAAPRRHEVVEPLAAVIRAADLPRGPFDRMLSARQRDVEGEAPPDRAALDAYLADTGGALLALSAGALAPGAGETAALRDAGYAFAAAAWLRALPTLLARGAAALPPGEAARPLARSVAEAGASALRRARAGRGEIPRAAAPAMRAGWRAGRTLAGALRSDFDPASGPPEAPESARRLALLWRAARGVW